MTGRPLLIATLAAALFVALAASVAPHVHVSPRAADLVTFFFASFGAIVAVAFASRAPIAPRATLVVDLVAVALLATIAIAHPSSPFVASIADAALIAAAAATGALVGGRIQDAGHLLPACIVAACADVVSVLSPHGPTHAIVENERALSVLAISFPVIGTHVAAPVLGAGDLVFTAVVLGAAVRHALPYARVAVLAIVGVLAAGALAAIFERAIPALPTIAAAILLGVPAARKVHRRDRTVATIAIGVSIAIAGWTLVRAV